MIDPSIIWGAVVTLGLAVAGYMWRTHVVCVDRRLTAVERRIGGTDEDPAISEQLAVMATTMASDAERVKREVELRHEENKRRFDELRDLVLSRPQRMRDPWA